MNSNTGACCAVVVVGCLTLPAHSAVKIGPNVIVKGNTIEVVGPGPDLQAIIDGITDATSDKPYLITLGAGNYTITPAEGTGNGLVMAEHISIKGSGVNATTLTGAVSSGVSGPASAIVSGADNTTLTDLSVVNTGGGGTYSIGIYNAASPRIERVYALAKGGTSINNGIRISSSLPTLIHVEAVGQGGTSTTNFGVDVGSSSPTLTHVRALAQSGTENYGVRNVFSSPTMTNVTATGSGGVTNYGVFNDVVSSPTLTNVTANGFGGTTSYGMYSRDSSSATVTRFAATGKNGTNNYGVYSEDNTVVLSVDAAVLTGNTAALRFGGNTGTRIANSHVDGNVINNPGGVNCGGVYNVNLTLVNC